MTQEDKKLLIKDLCARLPYGVHAAINNKHQEYKGELLGIRQGGYYQMFFTNGEWYRIEVIKPYLFPISSMTEKQKEELLKLSLSTILNDSLMLKVIDWLNKNHFDYRGLIEKGLTIDATNLNIY